ncbi:MAG: hypothetical protein JST16_00750 [Bdellovibrionales bacterium]|nr:hypothetical protein [Bdellovibrionales bacterium]
MNKTVLFSLTSLLMTSAISRADSSISMRPLRTLKLGAQLTVPYEASHWKEGVAFQKGHSKPLSEVDMALPYCEFDFSAGMFPEGVENFVLNLSAMEGAYVEGIGAPNFRTTLEFSGPSSLAVNFTCSKKAGHGQFDEMTVGEFEIVFGSLASWTDASFTSVPVSQFNPDFMLQPQRLHADISVKVDRDLVFNLVGSSRDISIQNGVLVQEIDFNQPFCKLVYETTESVTLHKDEVYRPTPNSIVGSYRYDAMGFNGFTTMFTFNEGRGLLQCDSGSLSPLTYGQVGQITRNILTWTIHDGP